MKIVINRCFGGFGLSDAAFSLYLTKKQIAFHTTITEFGVQFFGEHDSKLYPYNIDRTDDALIEVIEEMGQLACGTFSELKIVEIPDGVEWELEDYDGNESIHEKHRIWI